MEHKSKNDIYWKSEMTTQIKEITTEQRDRIFKNSSHSMYSNNFKIHRQKKKKANTVYQTGRFGRNILIFLPIAFLRMKQGLLEEYIFFFFFFLGRASLLASQRTPFPPPYPSIQFWGPWSFSRFNMEVIGAVAPGTWMCRWYTGCTPNCPLLFTRLIHLPASHPSVSSWPQREGVLEATGKGEVDGWL